MNMFKKLGAWLRDVFTGAQRYSHIAVDDVPDALEPQRVYLIGEDNNFWSAAFLCPCGCAAVIQLSLIPEDKPRWRATIRNERVTLSPSVWRITGCRSHFFIRDGKIVWSK